MFASSSSAGIPSPECTRRPSRDGRTRWSLVTPQAWGGVLFSSLFSTGLAYLLWYRGVQTLGGPRTAVFSNLMPVVALIARALWLGEQQRALTVTGAVMVIVGVMFVRAPVRPPARRSF